MTNYKNKPIEIFNAHISNRALNFLIKNNIYTTDNLREKGANFLYPVYPTKGIGKISMNEIKKILDILKESNEYEDYIINKNTPEESVIIDESIKYDIRDINNMGKLYIPIKRNKTRGYNTRELRKTDINKYLQSIYQKTNTFNIYIFIECLLGIFSEAENLIIKHRLCFTSKEYLTLEDVAKKTNLTRERIRQTEVSLINKLEEIFKELGKTAIGNFYIEGITIQYNIKEYGMIYIEKDNNYIGNINNYFLGYAISRIIGDKYDHLFLNEKNEVGERLYIYKKDISNKKIVTHIVYNINKFIYKKRAEDQEYTKELFIAKIGGEYGYDILINKIYEDIIIKYLYVVYSIFSINGIFSFPQNKTDLKFLVKKELQEIDNPIHFNDMYDIVVKKYPEEKWNIGKIHGILMKNAKNVGNGLYVRGDHDMIGGTIGNIAEKYLMKKGKPIEYIELENHILENKITQKDSILTLLFDQDKKKRFVKILGNKVALTKRNCNDVVNNNKKEYNLDKHIYEILYENKITEFTIEEIKKKLKEEFSYFQIRFALKKLLRKGSISYITKNNSNYYYVL